ncbi:MULTISPECIES: DNA replication/repair protein RecF [unclassified Leucobacter]|uniref:DNA replication/repair protein RecF n=1 Tax=unclassified Leucobacter TaxID=2621730 RepID=UPI00165E0CAD|nr:DNA replication/repair protein RecF [Leucobacter sp. cx-87]
MRVVHLTLSDYRNYEAAELELSPGANLLLGRNGQGKTNLVEAIAYFAGLSSHRVTSDAPLIRAGADSAVMRMRVQLTDRDALLELQLNRDRPNRAQINRNGTKPREITQYFSSVVFAPEDLSLVRGDPGIRRRFLDEGLVARIPAAAGVIADYERVVRQRTALLKSARSTGKKDAVRATLDVWDERLIDLGSRIVAERARFVRDLAEPLALGYAALVENDHRPTMHIASSIAAALSKGADVSRETALAGGVGAAGIAGSVSRETISAAFRRALDAVRTAELDRGLTLVGPHRDDLVLELNGLPVKGYASHGESWSFALALRLATARLFRAEARHGDPVVILDDVFAELDERRRSRLMAAVRDFEQVIVTAAVQADVPADVPWRIARVEAGVVRQDADARAQSEMAQNSPENRADTTQSSDSSPQIGATEAAIAHDSTLILPQEEASDQAKSGELP